MRRRVSVSEHLDRLTCNQIMTPDDTRIEVMKRIADNAIDGTLTKRQQECLRMYYYDKMNLVQIGDALTLDPSTVSRHIKAARKKLERLRALI